MAKVPGFTLELEFEHMHERVQELIDEEYFDWTFPLKVTVDDILVQPSEPDVDIPYAYVEEVTITTLDENTIFHTLSEEGTNYVNQQILERYESSRTNRPFRSRHRYQN